MLATAPILSLVLAATAPPSFTHRVENPRGGLSLGIGVLTPPLEGSLRSAVRGYALSRRAELGLPASSTLGEPQAFGTRFGASFHLPQQVDGVDVYGAKVVVTVGRDRRVFQVASSVSGYARAAMSWRIGGEQAARIASNEIPFPSLQPNGAPFGGHRRQVFVLGDEAHAGYLVHVASLDPRRYWLVAVDATDGRVLWKKDRVFHSDGAQVYASSPGGLDGGVGVTPLSPVELRHADGGSMVAANDGGFLIGHQLVAYGCCPNEDCSTAPDAGPKHGTGTTQVFGINVTYDVAECDRVQRAVNDPALNPDASYVFEPYDPPTVVNGKPAPVAQSELADSDPFSEVHAFFHVNNVYDFVRSLSTAAAPLFPGEAIPPFQMRDEKRTPAEKPAVWANVTFPDFEDVMNNFNPFTGQAKTDKLTRVDNAAFIARENFEQLVLADYMLDVDTLMIFQGHGADFAYDAPVLWHEFGHGVIHSTAAFDSFIIDDRSGNDEGGALHEGIADYLAAAFGQRSRIGEYVGPRLSGGGTAGSVPQDVSLRDLENGHRCPEVLQGEVHQDSQHFSEALWQARKDHFQGSDAGRTFDAAIYAALVSMTPATGFVEAATIITAHVKNAFPANSQAEEQIKAVFDQRGVTHCSKVVDLTGASAPRPYYHLGGTQQAGASPVPGPYQMKLSVPQGASGVTVTAKVQSGFFGGGQTQAKLLAKVGQPITFSRNGSTVTDDADTSADATLSGSNLTAQVTLDAPCDGEVFFTLVTEAQNGETLSDVSVSAQVPTECRVETPDAGGPPPPVVVPAIPDGGTHVEGPAPGGCGCAGAPGAALSAIAALALLVRRGRGRRASAADGRAAAGATRLP